MTLHSKNIFCAVKNIDVLKVQCGYVGTNNTRC